MITSFEVGSVFRIVDQATPTLLKISAELAKIEGKTITVGAELAKIGRMRLGGITSALGRVDKAMGNVATATGTMVGKITADLARADARLTQTTTQVNQLTAALRQAGQAGATLRLPGPGGAHPRPGGGGGGGAGGGGGHGGGSGQAGHVGLGLGVFGFVGAAEVGHGLKTMLHAASELEHVQQQMNQAGFKQVDIANATAAAWKEAERYGLNVSKVMSDIKELALPFGSVEHAIEFIDPLEKMRIVLNAVSEGKGNSAAESVYKMARAGELKGLQSPEDFLSYFNNMTKVISASGGKVTPNDFAQVTKYGKLASMGWDEEFYTKYLPTLMQTMGASTAGTSLMSLFGTLAQGTVTKRALGRMDDLGLIGDQSKIIYDNKGDPKGFNPGAIQGTEMLVRNPFEWAQKILLPLLEKKYGDIGIDANKQKAIEDLGGLFGNRNSAAAIAELALRGKTFEKDAQLNRNARGLEGAEHLLGEDPVVVAEKLKGAWSNLMTALGGPGVAAAVSAMNSLASGITTLTKFATDHPEGVKIALTAMEGLAIGLGALAVVGVAAGAALLAPGGAVAIAVATVGGMIAAFSYENWDKVKEAATGIKSAFDTIASSITSFWDRLKGLFSGKPGSPDLYDAHPFLQSYGGGSGLGSLIHKSSFGSNDNIPASSVARAVQGATGGRSAAGLTPEAIAAAQASQARWGVPASISLGQYGIESNFGRQMPSGSNNPFGIKAHGDQPFVWAPTREVINGRSVRVMQRFRKFGSFAEAFDEHGRLLASNSAYAAARAAGVNNPEGYANGLGRYATEPAYRSILQQRQRPFLKYNQLPTVAPPPPVVGPPPRSREETHIHNVYLDGSKIERHVTRRQVAKARYPTATGGMDGYGSWVPPGTTLTDAA